ncbi:hypothetical protein ROM86_07820 [Cronobacter malonaticus]|uniref:hypothetical protein n=1 Tax=Cronobacter malonaticus TaxID=413503 RepID=UPI00289400F2|nr:hypothetical protein [Cronobacter malonaticus]MDT3600011.1 hypothetical protein [Cronobacter malonaticus]MDT3642959.1 hypothetical protein [Cronobacter malonaticus]
MDKSREQFEVVYEQMKNDRFGTNEEWAWKFWQASRAAVEIELDEKVMVEDEFDKGHNCAIDYCAESIRSAGLKVKGE